MSTLLLEVGLNNKFFKRIKWQTDQAGFYNKLQIVNPWNILATDFLHHVLGTLSVLLLRCFKCNSSELEHNRTVTLKYTNTYIYKPLLKSTCLDFFSNNTTKANTATYNNNNNNVPPPSLFLSVIGSHRVLQLQ